MDEDKCDLQIWMLLLLFHKNFNPKFAWFFYFLTFWLLTNFTIKYYIS